MHAPRSAAILPRRHTTDPRRRQAQRPDATARPSPRDLPVHDLQNLPLQHDQRRRSTETNQKRPASSAPTAGTKPSAAATPTARPSWPALESAPTMTKTATNPKQTASPVHRPESSGRIAQRERRHAGGRDGPPQARSAPVLTSGSPRAGAPHWGQCPCRTPRRRTPHDRH